MTRPIAVKQGSTISREPVFGTKTIGASASLKELRVKFRFTRDNVYAAAKHQLARKE